MDKHMRLIVTLLAMTVLTSACLLSDIFANGDETDARTYYESLNLESPEDAIQTFSEAFQRGDYQTVYLVLDGKSQHMIRLERARVYSMDHLIGERANDRLNEHLSIGDLYYVQADFWYTFDRIMVYTAEQDDLLIDLRGDLDILRVEDARPTDGRQTVDVIGSVEGVQGHVIFRTVLDADDRWRVFLVSAPEEGVDSWPSTMLIDDAD